MRPLKEDITQEIVSRGQDRIRSLEKLGLKFDLRKGKETEYDLGKEGGHSHRRILHCGDITGQAIMHTLEESVRENPNITLLENVMAIDLITTSWLKVKGPNHCIGAYFLDRSANKIISIQAGATLLACGGVGKSIPIPRIPI